MGRLSGRAGTGILLLVSLVAGASGFSADPGTKREYYERLAKLPPRNAQAHVELADWCRKAGLEGEAIALYRLAIQIDPDCEGAREALGYRRWGTAWITAEELKNLRTAQTPQSRARPAESAEKSLPPRESSAGSKVPAPAEKAQPAAKEAPTEEGVQPEARLVQPKVSPAKPSVQPPRSEASSEFEAAVAKKREWAAAAAAKASLTFVTEEDQDFLIHTTLPRSSAELREFKANLRAIKKLLVTLLALRSNSKIWPEKLQFVLLRSAPEYERFAQLVDGIPAPRNPEGAYTKDGHTVVLRPDTPVLPRLLGTTALEKLDGSDKHVGWWLAEGLGEWLFAQSAAGQAQDFVKNEYLRASEFLRTEGKAFRIFDLIDSAENTGRDAVRNRTLAFTLVDFLSQVRARGLAEFVSLLKSEKAPSRASSKEDAAAFFASYTSFQETAFVAAFRRPVAEIEEKWKQFVLARGEAFRAKEASSPATSPKVPRARN